MTSNAPRVPPPFPNRERAPLPHIMHRVEPSSTGGHVANLPAGCFWDPTVLFPAHDAFGAYNDPGDPRDCCGYMLTVRKLECITCVTCFPCHVGVLLPSALACLMGFGCYTPHIGIFRVDRHGCCFFESCHDGKWCDW